MYVSLLSSVFDQIDKSKFELLYKESMWYFKYDTDTYTLFLNEYFERYLGYECEKSDNSGPVNSKSFNLSSDNVESLLSEIPEASLDLISCAVDPCDYQKECLSLLNLLNDKGVAVIYIPANIVNIISRDLKSFIKLL